MKKSYIRIFVIAACAMSPLFSDGFSVLDRELVAEKGIFPPEDSNNTTSPPGQNEEAQKEKPLLPPEEPKESTPAPGPNPNTQPNTRPDGTVRPKSDPRSYPSDPEPNDLYQQNK